MDPEDANSAGSARVQPPVPEQSAGAPLPAAPGHVQRSRTSGVLIGVIIAAIVLILLLIFILQNTTSVTIHFFGISGDLPIAVALLLAAICGLLLVAIPGTIRIMQLRKTVKNASRID